MPNSKNADVRIKVIDRCLSDKNRKYSMAEMMELCNEELELHDFPPVSAMNTIRGDKETVIPLAENSAYFTIFFSYRIKN